MTASLSSIIVYSDGASRMNPGPAAIAYSIYDSENNILEKDSKFIGETTNNEAEYRALLWAMEQAASQCRGCVRFHTDSELVARHYSGQYRIKSGRLRPFLEQVYVKEKLFEKCEIVHVPRENPRIQEVDAAVNEALQREGFG